MAVDDLADGFNVHVAWSQKSGGPQNAVTAGISGAGQVWAKPQPGGALAVLVINTGIEPLTQHSLNFPKLNLTTGTYTVRDIWEKKDLGAATGQFPVTVHFCCSLRKKLLSDGRAIDVPVSARSRP